MFAKQECAGRLSASAKARVVITAAVLGIFEPSILHAALPIYAGPGDPPTNMGYVTGAGGSQVTNTGLVIGTARRYTSGFNSYGAPFRYGANIAPQELKRSTNSTFSQSYFVFVTGINLAGTSIVSDTSNVAGASRGLRFAAGSIVPEDLQPLTTASNLPNDTAAYDINDAGVVAGYADSSFGNIDLGQRAAIWTAGTTAATQLKTIQTGMGRITENATQINEAGEISGNAIHYKPGVSSGPGVSQGVRPVRWASATADPVELQLLNARTDSFSEGDVYDMNEGGTTVGVSHRYSGMSDLGVHAARWSSTGTAITELLTPSGFAARYSQSQADEINNAGTTIGYAFDPTPVAQFNPVDDRRPIRWTAGSNVGVELAPLGTTTTGKAYSLGRSINNLGHTVGYSAVTGDANGSYAAVVWKSGSTTPINLNTLIDPATGWYLTFASSISDTGFVTGSGAFKPAGSLNYYDKAFTILVPQLGTYGLGDANFDTVVNFDDLVTLAQHYNETNASLNIHVADFNFDGKVNFDDLVPLAQNYNSSLGSGLLTNAGFAVDWAFAQSLVPEPTTTVMAVAALAPMCRRRSRKC